MSSDELHERERLRQTTADANRDAIAAWEGLMAAIQAAVEKALAEVGVEVHGQLRGVVHDTGRPETGNGFAVDVGDGLPPGWLKKGGQG